MDIIRIFRKPIRLAAILAVASFGLSCTEMDENFGIDGSEEGINYNYPGNRIEHQETRRVILFYECGFNSLYSDLKNDMEVELPKGYIPGNTRKDDVILVYSKLAKNKNYKDVPSYLRRIYKDPEGNLVSDTLKTYPATTVATSGETMREVLSFVKSSFPAKGYGMVFASHGSGWLPAGYYNNPSAFEKNHRKSSGMKKSKESELSAIPKGSMEEDDPFAGMVRSIGQDVMATEDVEMTVSEFVGGIPFHLDYLFFDMCFSGGVEVAYALRDKADYLGVSPAEVLADGMFDYTGIADFLLKPAVPDLKGLFEASFKRYDNQSGDYRSATVTLVRTDGLERLADVCKSLVAKYSDSIAHAPVDRIQGYFRKDRHYFYDLEDTFVKCGASEADLKTLRDALQGCIVYKAATPEFLGFPIDTYSGFSIYLPCNGTTLLNSYFKDEEWNKAVGLVKYQ